MRKILFCILFLCLCVFAKAQNCCSGHTDDCRQGSECCKEDSVSMQDVSPSTLIIYYSGNSKKILKLAKRIRAEVLYKYNNFNAIAIRKPNNMTLEETKYLFEKQKFVLQVSYDHIYHLD